MKTKFLIFTDLHVDIMHDTVARMEIITRAAKEADVDFILHLGDIMYPEQAYVQQYAPQCMAEREDAWFLCDRDDEKTVIRELLAETGKKVYGVLGNHDMDSCDKATACRYWGMPAPYYAFVEGGVRFLVLDANYIRTPEGDVDFYCNNYKNYKRVQTSYLPPEQLQWLEQEIMASAEPCVLLSHASLADEILNINNMQEVWAILDRVNQDKRRVFLGINGHSHIDGLTVRRHIPFLNINSASNIWIGRQYATLRYSKTIMEHYPHLKGCAPYYDPLYTIMTIEDDKIEMTGCKSSFVGKAPYELGFPESASYFDPSPCIRARRIPTAALPEEGKVLDKYFI